jgi:hypothetical protein
MIDHVVWAQIDDIASAWFGSVHGFVSFLFAIEETPAPSSSFSSFTKIIGDHPPVTP